MAPTAAAVMLAKEPHTVYALFTTTPASLLFPIKTVSDFSTGSIICKEIIHLGFLQARPKGASGYHQEGKSPERHPGGTL